MQLHDVCRTQSVDMLDWRSSDIQQDFGRTVWYGMQASGLNYILARRLRLKLLSLTRGG